MDLIILLLYRDLYTMRNCSIEKKSNNFRNLEHTSTAEVSAAMTGYQHRVSSSCTILLFPEVGRPEVAQRGKSVDSINHTQATDNTFTVLIHLSCIALCFSEVAGVLKVLHSDTSSCLRGLLLFSLHLTCAFQLLQVWNMAATETQLMLSVGLIGKSRFNNRLLLGFLV